MPSSLRPVIDDGYFVEVWLKDLDKGLMIGMDQVRIAIFFTPECDKKTVRQALVQILRTVVGTPFELFDQRDLPCQPGKSVFHFFYVSSAGGILEFE